MKRKAKRKSKPLPPEGHMPTLEQRLRAEYHAARTCGRYEIKPNDNGRMSLILMPARNDGDEVLIECECNAAHLAAGQTDVIPLVHPGGRDSRDRE